MKKIPFELRSSDGRCLTPCPYGHITNKQKATAKEYFMGDNYVPTSPMVNSTSCIHCEHYNGREYSTIACAFEDNVHKGEEK